MKISSYISLFDDWELLEASLKSIDPLVEEIVVVDGAYNWMRPSFGSSRRDVTRSLDPVYDVLSTFGGKVRVITGVWENELEKRVAGFEACSNRHVFRHDADEILYLDQPALERFFRSGLGVAEMTMPIYAAPGWIIAMNPARIERQSCLFDRSVISARDHLSYLWLVLSSEERQSLAGRDRGQVFQETIAFNAHLTHWRPPATAVNRARFCVLNYVRSSGKLGWYPSFTYSAESGFRTCFRRLTRRHLPTFVTAILSPRGPRPWKITPCIHRHYPPIRRQYLFPSERDFSMGWPHLMARFRPDRGQLRVEPSTFLMSQRPRALTIWHTTGVFICNSRTGLPLARSA